MKAARHVRHSVVALLAAGFAAWSSQADVAINVPDGETWDFYTALKASGYDAYPTAQSAVKTGLGTLVSTNDLTKAMRGVVVSQGVVRFAVNNDVGVTGYAITVNDGGTAQFVTGMAMNNRSILLAGQGAVGTGGALVGSGSFSAGNFGINLTADATVCSLNDSAYWPVFAGGSSTTPSLINLDGHALTVRSAAGCPGLGVFSRMRMKSSGTVVVDGTTFAECSPDKDIKPALENDYRIVDPGVYVSLVLTNGAVFRAKSQALPKLFGGFDCAEGTTIDSVDGNLKYHLTTGDFAGAPTFGTGVLSLAVTNSLTVRVSDLSASRNLSLRVPLAFGDGCALKIAGDVRNLNPDHQGRIVIAHSDVGVTGCPALPASKETRHWRVSRSEDGLDIVLVYDSLKPEGAIDVRTQWGVTVGQDGVTGNAARFNTALAGLTAEKAVLYFPEGDYYFDASLVIARDNVTVLGDGGASVLHAADVTMTGLLSVTGASGVTVTQTGFADCSGTAASAENATGFSFTNNFYTSIGGNVEGIDGTHPVSAKNSTGTRVKFNRVTDGAVYSSLCCHVGGSMSPDSDPYAKRRIWVEEGVTEDFLPAFAAMGLGTDYTPAAGMEKWGPGTLVATNIYGGSGAAMTGLEIAEGVYRARKTWDFGRHANPATVRKGATLEYDCSDAVYDRALLFSGAGAPGKTGAVVLMANPSLLGMSVRLEDDATVSSLLQEGYARFFGRPKNQNKTGNKYYLGGHALRLVAGDGCPGFCYGDELTLKDTGTILVDGTTLAEQNDYTAADQVKFSADAGARVTLKLVNGARFLPLQQAFVSVLSGIDAECGTTIDGKVSSFGMTVGTFAGAGSVGENIASLTVSDTIVVRAADLVAGRALQVSGTLNFAPGAKLRLEGDFSDVKPGRYVCAVSSSGITGLPVKDFTSGFKSFSAGVQGGNTLYVDLKPGLMLMIR